MISRRQAEAFVFAALVHDVGHWPFCHPIDDMQLASLGAHESRIEQWLQRGELATCLEQDWECQASDVLELLDPKLSNAKLSSASISATRPETDPQSQRGKEFLVSCLSGPIDIDKLDYLQRDSLHAGVPYGRNFDVGRLINSICVHPESGRLAIGEKGRTAAEMMVFSRYVMFSEVYWHHAVRAATAMLQRAVFLLQNRIDLPSTLRMTDAPWIALLRRAAEGSVAEPLVEGLFGPRRRLYKRAAEFTLVDGGEVHQSLARRPYWWLVAVSERLAAQLASRIGMAIHAADMLVDAPPVKREVDINIDVVGRDGQTHPLGQVSPVAAALAQQQFDNQVKRVRVFVRDDLRDSLRRRLDDEAWRQELLEANQTLEKELI
jgi:HD superfamily phosphohydrolase